MLNVLINLPVLERIRYYVSLVKGEVSALGIVEKDGEDLVVTDIYLPVQTCSAASTEMDPEDLAKLLLDLEQQGRDPRTLRFWWHSHGTMKPFWSQTDNETIEELANDGFVLSIVTNKAGENLARVDVFQPFRFTIHDVKVEPLLPEYGLGDECAAQIKEKVREDEPRIILRGSGR